MRCTIVITVSMRRLTSIEVARAREYATRSHTELEVIDPLRMLGHAAAGAADIPHALVSALTFGPMPSCSSC